jgi:hypothetical protein
MVVAASVSDLSDKLASTGPERRYFSRTHADEMCALLNQRRDEGHPGFIVEELEIGESTPLVA